MELTGLFYPRYTSYTKVNIGTMPLGENRLRATFQEAEPDLRGGLLFPLMFYHDRWSQLTAADYRLALGQYGTDDLAGYTFLDTYCETEGVYERALTLDEENYRRNLTYLEEIRDVCQARDILPVFYVAPGLGRFSQMEAATSQLAQGVTVLDCNALYEAIGIDRQTDYHDTLHFNFSGADKFSHWLAAWMDEQLDLTATTPKDPHLWAQRVEYWAACTDVALSPKETF